MPIYQILPILGIFKIRPEMGFQDAVKRPYPLW